MGRTRGGRENGGACISTFQPKQVNNATHGSPRQGNKNQQRIGSKIGKRTNSTQISFLEEISLENRSGSKGVGEPSHQPVSKKRGGGRNH